MILINSIARFIKIPGSRAIKITSGNMDMFYGQTHRAKEVNRHTYNVLCPLVEDPSLKL